MILLAGTKKDDEFNDLDLGKEPNKDGSENLGLDDNELDSEDFGGLYDDDGDRTMDKHAELLRGLTNFDPYLISKFSQWCGVYWDEETKVYKKDDHIKPILNVRGAMYFISFLKTYVRDNNIITVLPEHIFRFCMQDILITTFQSIAQYYDEFGISSSADQSRIMSEMENSAQLILSGSVGGEYNQFIGGTYRAGYQDSVGTNNGQQRGLGVAPPPKRSGLMSKIKNVFN